jgi:hypothetical protein
MRKVTVIAKPRRIPQVQTARVLNAAEQQVRDELKAKLFTAIFLAKLSRAA